ncbi:MAG: hypothetical protein E7300_00945 [Lachnospiraceae bacterium]|nr:hypothetical protein [Lachnospiraceae bacterium]
MYPALFVLCMYDIQRAPEYGAIARKIIRHIPELRFIRDAKIRIAYLSSDEEKHHGPKTVFADCRKVDPIYSPWCKYDFLITVYAPNVADFTENQIKVLLWHELLHVGLDDKTLDPKYIVNPHDIEEFRVIMDRFGVDWSEPGRDLPDILESDMSG